MGMLGWVVQAGAVDGDGGGGLSGGLVRVVIQLFDERTVWGLGRRRIRC